MHESAIATAILETALQACAERSRIACAERSRSILPDKQKRITKFTVVAGVLAGVEQTCLELYLAELAKATPAEGAQIVLKPIAATLVCSACGQQESYPGKGPVRIECGQCGSLNRLQGGRELYLESIEIEDF